MSPFPFPQVVFDGEGNDELVTSFGRDQLLGEDRNDLLIAFDGDDELMKSGALKFALTQ